MNHTVKAPTPSNNFIRVVPNSLTFRAGIPSPNIMCGSIFINDQK